jgi:molybdopterin-guanine dinucleotide biosynthesis protein A
MGQDKALIALDGSAMAERVVAALVGGGASAIEVIGDDPAIARGLDLPQVRGGWASRDDLWKGIGPLGGLATAVVEARPTGPGTHDESRAHTVDAFLARRALDDVIVVVAACDQPDLTASLVGDLVAAVATGGPDVVASAVRTADGRRHPFPSAWRAAAGPAIAALIADGARRADAAFGAGVVVDVDAPSAVVVDLDTPDDVRRWHEGRHGA